MVTGEDYTLEVGTVLDCDDETEAIYVALDGRPGYIKTWVGAVRPIAGEYTNPGVRVIFDWEEHYGD